ncbi:MAG TPA: DegV family protein, partial [Chloroflexi bacterium]|nr:DegV family protein [Chloroflexota bacterium]
SGTVNAARLGAEMVPEANITIVDSKTLSGALGWQVEAAARAIQAGWPLEKILETVAQVGRATETLFTLPELKYLIHGGRISHLKGLLASVLNIKPLIGVDKESGKYAERGKARTFARALRHIGEVITQQVPAGSALRVQVMHANNPDGAAVLREQLDRLFECTWLPEAPIAPVLGAHAGPGLVGAAYAPLSAFPALP